MDFYFYNDWVYIMQNLLFGFLKIFNKVEDNPIVEFENFVLDLLGDHNNFKVVRFACYTRENAGLTVKSTGDMIELVYDGLRERPQVQFLSKEGLKIKLGNDKTKDLFLKKYLSVFDKFDEDMCRLTIEKTKAAIYKSELN